jgi:hypothetical protein
VIYLHGMFYTALGRAAAVALATLLLFGLVFLREATSPSGAGYWTAMAAAPNGDLYVADEVHRELRLVHPVGGWQRLAAVPPGIFRALAASGPNLLLATEGQLYVSNDTGSTWRAAIPGRFTAVAVDGNQEYAGAWSQALYVSGDAGRTWAKAAVPPGDTQFEAIIPGYAATLLGLLETRDSGKTWTRVAGIPDRVTAVAGAVGSQVVRAGDWRGAVWLYDPRTRVVEQSAAFPGGVVSVNGPLVATTSGVYPDRPGPLHGREVSRVVVSEGFYWAARAKGGVYVADNDLIWRLAYQS